MKKKHRHEATGGDWFVDTDESEFTISTTAGILIGRVYAADDFPCREEGTDADINGEQLANAWMMAASRDLCEALEALLPHARVKSKDLGRLERAYAAVRKARFGERG